MTNGKDFYNNFDNRESGLLSKFLGILALALFFVFLLVVTRWALVWLLLIILGAFVYFLPSLIAHKRDKRNKTAITLLNVLLGWTFLGWVVSLVWAVSEY